MPASGGPVVATKHGVPLESLPMLGSSSRAAARTLTTGST
jgi:hypothetical protein